MTYMPESAIQPRPLSWPPTKDDLDGARDIDINYLCELALDGLMPMFDADAGLFCYQRKRTSGGMICKGVSHRYTVITLIGLLRCEAVGMRTPFDVEAILTRLLERLQWVEGIGDLGLLLWLCALSPRHFNKLCSTFDIKDAPNRFRDASEGKTTELAWFLAGVAHAAMAIPEHRSAFADAASQVYRWLVGNQGQGGLFGHLSKRRTIAAALRSHVGCFADQIYPIYALTRFAEAFDDDGAFGMAQKCAEAICRLQGPLGQWWWHYDSVTSQIFGKYPVFSVHQDGMAPMALFALGDTTNRDFGEAIHRGLQWIGGSNELTCDLRDTSKNIIWRSIHRGGKYKTYLGGALTALRPKANTEFVGHLQVNHECRPYHFGWLLYAFAGRQSRYAQQS